MGKSERPDQAAGSDRATRNRGLADSTFAVPSWRESVTQLGIDCAREMIRGRLRRWRYEPIPLPLVLHCGFVIMYGQHVQGAPLNP